MTGTYENPNVSEREGRFTAHIATQVRTFPVRGRGATAEEAITEARRWFHARFDKPLYHRFGLEAERL